MKKNSKRGTALLLLTAIIWGMAFIAQSVAMDNVGPWTFNGTRFIIGGATLLAVMPFFKDKEADKHDKKILWKGGLLSGVFLSIGATFQQYGVSMTTVGKAGFITALYVVFVPLLSSLFGSKPSKRIWGCVLLSVVGLYFLCMNESLHIATGDLLVLICAVFFAIHIVCVGHFSPYTDGIRMSCIQFFTAGVICLIPAILFEKPDMQALTAAAAPILYGGVMSSGAGYTLQVLGQKDVNPSVASLLMSLESVFAVIGGWLVLQQTLSFKELLGCGLTFAAVIISQLPERK